MEIEALEAILMDEFKGVWLLCWPLWCHFSPHHS